MASSRCPLLIQSLYCKLMLGLVLLFITCSAFTVTAAGQEPDFLSADDLASLRDIGGHHMGAFSVSPNGRWIAFQLQTPDSENGDYDLKWMTLPSGGGAKPTFIADGGDIILNPDKAVAANGNRPPVKAKWSPDSKKFAYTLKMDGEIQIWVSRPGRRGQRQLTRGPRDVTSFSWSRDGSKIYYRTGADKNTLSTLHADERREGLLHNHRLSFGVTREYWPHYKICRGDSSIQTRVNLEYDCEQRLWIYDLKTKFERLATSEEKALEKALYESFLKPSLPAQVDQENRPAERVRRWDASERYSWLENEDPEIYAGARPPLRLHAYYDGKVYRCAADECLQFRHSDQNHWWSKDGSEIVFPRREGWNLSEIAFYGWTLATGALRKIRSSKEDWLRECEPAGDRIVCLHETMTSPPKIVSMSAVDGQIKLLYDPNPVLYDRKFTKIEKLEWEDKFGNQTHGFLVYPKDYDPSRTYPMVIVTYRSKGFLRGGIGDEYPIHPLAAQGFFVLSHDMPFDTEIMAREENPQAALDKDLYWRNSVLSSQEIIIDKLVERGLVDFGCVALTGLSEGSAQVFYALINSDKFAAFVSSGVGASEKSIYLTRKSRRRSWIARYGGYPGDPDSYWDKVAIDQNVHTIDAPLLLNVPDYQAPFAAIEVALLKDAGKPVEMYIFSDEFHIKWRPDHRLAIYRRNIQWLKFWLKGEIDPDPVSPGQYERWLRLCRQHVANHASAGNTSSKRLDHLRFCLDEGADGVKY